MLSRRTPASAPPAADGLPMRWIKLHRYCEITGDTPNAVHAKRRKRQWIDGVHCKVGPDGNLWINPEEVNRWVESQATSVS